MPGDANFGLTAGEGVSSSVHTAIQVNAGIASMLRAEGYDPSTINVLKLRAGAMRPSTCTYLANESKDVKSSTGTHRFIVNFANIRWIGNVCLSRGRVLPSTGGLEHLRIYTVSDLRWRWMREPFGSEAGTISELDFVNDYGFSKEQFHGYVDICEAGHPTIGGHGITARELLEQAIGRWTSLPAGIEYGSAKDIPDLSLATSRAQMVDNILRAIGCILIPRFSPLGETNGFAYPATNIDCAFGQPPPDPPGDDGGATGHIAPGAELGPIDPGDVQDDRDYDHDFRSTGPEEDETCVEALFTVQQIGGPISDSEEYGYDTDTGISGATKAARATVEALKDFWQKGGIYTSDTSAPDSGPLVAAKHFVGALDLEIPDKVCVRFPVQRHRDPYLEGTPPLPTHEMICPPVAECNYFSRFHEELTSVGRPAASERGQEHFRQVFDHTHWAIQDLCECYATHEDPNDCGRPDIVNRDYCLSLIHI